MKQFFTCWLEGTHGGYGYQHPTLEAAQTEAKRIAALPGNDGKAVFVLAYVGCMKTERVKWEGVEVDEVPF